VVAAEQAVAIMRAPGWRMGCRKRGGSPVPAHRDRDSDYFGFSGALVVGLLEMSGSDRRDFNGDFRPTCVSFRDR